jgi:hypothetical protein
MKVFAEKAVISQELTDVRCNKCGRALHKDDAGYFEDYLSVSKKWGYHSPIDGDSHEFDICVDCYRDLVNGFKIPPEGLAGEAGEK